MKIFVKLILGYAVISTALSAQSSCDFQIAVGDNLQFSQDKVVARKACGTVTINLKHEGKLPKNMMGHNWVLTHAKDVSAVATDGMSAGLNNQYVKAGDSRVIAFSDIIGGGEETSVSFNIEALSTSEDYIFFCSFPGHFYAMRGILDVT